MRDERETPLLDVSNLTLKYRAASGMATILRDVNLRLERGQVLGIIGESGAGKSTLGNAILGLLPPQFVVTAGTIRFDGSLLGAMDRRDRYGVRRRKISAIFQDHTASLDPLMTIGAQLVETIRASNADLSMRQARARALDLLAHVGISEAQARYRRYPHQLSGGQRQRVVIAIALAGTPDIIVADEPTSALDATVQQQILRLLRSLVEETHVSVILVTHDMGVVAEIADRVLVMRSGAVVEQNATSAILDRPQEEYTQNLLAAVPRLRIARSAHDGGANSNPQGAAGRPDDETGETRRHILVARGVTKTFAAPAFSRWFGSETPKSALRNASLRLDRGAITGIVGESGSGKTTIGRIIAGLETACEGTIDIQGDVFDVSQSGRRNGLLGRVQMIFQDPAVSLNPRMTIAETLHESARFGAGRQSREGRMAVASMMDRLGLAQAFVARYPHQLSGGQKQRVCIARALLAKAEIIVADEPTSALDVSVQAEIVKLLQEIIAEQSISMLFISHDLALVQGLCNTIYIFKDGKVEDFGPSEFIFSHSKNPYTRGLVEARPRRFITDHFGSGRSQGGGQAVR